MLYLIWGLLNVAVLVLFVVVCFKATKLIRERIGLWAALLFVIGLLSFIGSSNSSDGNNTQNTRKGGNWQNTLPENIEPHSARFFSVTLQNNLISKYLLTIQYGKDKDQNNIPLGSSSFTQGAVSGIKWIPHAVAVNQTDDNNKFQYQVTGTVEWRFMGMLVYSQSRDYWDTVSVK